MQKSLQSADRVPMADASMPKRCVSCGASAAFFIREIADDDDSLLVCQRCGALQHETQFEAPSYAAGTQPVAAEEGGDTRSHEARSLRALRRALADACAVLRWSALEDEAFALFLRFVDKQPTGAHRFGERRGFLRVCACLLISARSAGRRSTIDEFCVRLAVEKGAFGRELRRVCRDMQPIHPPADALHGARSVLEACAAASAVDSAAVRRRALEVFRVAACETSLLSAANAKATAAAAFLLAVDEARIEQPHSAAKKHLAVRIADALNLQESSMAHAERRLRVSLAACISHLPWIAAASKVHLRIHRHLEDVVRFAHTRNSAAHPQLHFVNEEAPIAAEDMPSIEESLTPPESPPFDEAAFDAFIDTFVLVTDEREIALRKALFDASA